MLLPPSIIVRPSRRVAPPIGGGGSLPSWVPSSQWTWAQIPNSTMPAPAISHLGGTGAKSIYESWNGFCIDPVTSTVYAALNGGHDDYGWNGVMRHTLGETPSFTEIHAGSATSQYSRNGVNWDYYNDGLPASRHTGYGLMFDPLYGSAGRIIAIGGSRWDGGGDGSKFDFFDPSSLSWAAAGTMPNVTGVSIAGLCAITRVPSSGNVYFLVQNGALIRWNWASTGGSWASVTGSSGIDGYRTASAYDTLRDRIFYLGGGSTQNHHTFTISGSVTTNRTVTGAPVNDADLGMIYSPALDAYIARQSGSGGGLYLIDANTFGVTTPTTSGGSTIPTSIPGSGGGIFTKFLYAPLLKSVLLYPQYGQSAWVCRVDP